MIVKTFTVSLSDIEAWEAEGRSLSGTVETPVGEGNTLIVSVQKHPTNTIDGCFYPVFEITECFLRDENGAEYQPPALLERIDIAGCKRLWVGAYAENLSVSEAAKMHGCLPRYIVAEIRRGELKAAKVGRDWLIEADEFQRWQHSKRRRTKA